MAQQMIVYYWRVVCSTCGWQSDQIFHRGEEEKANGVFDQHQHVCLKSPLSLELGKGDFLWFAV